MNTRSILSCRFGRRPTASAAMIMALFGIVPVGTIADQPPATKTVNVANVAEVSLSDLNLSTPEGMRLTRERLHTMAERVCAGGDGGRGPSSQPALRACVDGTVANALRHIDALREDHLR
jgi:UrcA family protein